MSKENVTNVNKYEQKKNTSRLKNIEPMMPIVAFLAIAAAILFVVPGNTDGYYDGDQVLSTAGDTFADRPFYDQMTADEAEDEQVMITEYISSELETYPVHGIDDNIVNDDKRM